MIWHDIRDNNDRLLDELAARYGLHPLHIEDCRHGGQNAKVEFMANYMFVVLKTVEVSEECVIQTTDLDLFVGPDYVISVQEGVCQQVSLMMDRLKSVTNGMKPGELFHRIFDALVDTYVPVTDNFGDQIDKLEEEALQSPQSSTIEDLFDLRRALIELRRILANTRDILSHILRTDVPQLGRDLQPFFRDIYDHIARNLDTVEIQRDLITGATELYLSSVANQTNQVMKVLTVFGTVATPAIIITGVYGMNVKHLPFAESPHSLGIVMSIIGAVSTVTLLVLRKLKWL